MSASIKSTPDLKDLPYTSLFACFHNVQSWYIHFIALKHLFHSLHPFVSPRLGDFHIVIVQISGKIFAFDHTIRSYVDFMDLHRSWLDIMSWLDMHWYRGGKRDESYLAMSLDTLVIILVHWVQKFWYWGGFVAIKTNFCFERHVWTSAKNDTPWKRWEKCLWAWPLCW